MISLVWGSIPVVLLGNALCGLGGGMQATPCSSYYTEVTLFYLTELQCTVQVTSPHLRTPVHCLSGAVHCTGIVIPFLVTRCSLHTTNVSPTHCLQVLRVVAGGEPGGHGAPDTRPAGNLPHTRVPGVAGHEGK